MESQAKRIGGVREASVDLERMQLILSLSKEAPEVSEIVKALKLKGVEARVPR